MSNIGNKPEMHDSFITTILHRHRDSLQYAYEASVECGGGTLNWARRAKWFDSYKELNYLQPSKDELHFLPSFGEVLSPFWKKGGSGGLFGLNYSTSKEHILYSLL